MKYVINLLSIVILSAISSQPLLAQEAERKALARAQFMLNQVNAEKAQLQQQIAALQKEFDDYKIGTQNKLSNLSSRQKKTSSTLENWRESHGNLKDVLQTKVKELAQEKRRNAELLDIATKQSDNFMVCQKNNEELTRVNSALLDHYNKESMSLSITGFSQVKAQNFVQDYQHQVDDLDLRANKFLLKPVKKLSSLTPSVTGSDDPSVDEIETPNQ